MASKYLINQKCNCFKLISYNYLITMFFLLLKTETFCVRNANMYKVIKLNNIKK